MRNLKRALALVMATAMLLGMMVTGAGASYEVFTDSEEIVNTEAVDTMVSLGVINGRDTGAFDPTGTVTRAEMAKLIAVSLNGGSDPILGSGAATTTFTDTTGHWAESYIAYCANLGIINGYGDGTFGPDATVTGTAAAKMFLCALGYDSTEEGLTGTGWDLNTDTLANKIGLYSGFTSVSVSAGLSRDYTALLVYNGVQAYEVKYYTDAGTALTYPEANGTMLANRFGVTKVEGIVFANEVFAIDGGVATLADKSRIWVDADGDGAVDAGETETYPISIDDALVGLTVVIYVKYDSALSANAANSTVIGDAVVSAKNTVVETSAGLKDADAVKDAIKGSGISVDGTQTEYLFTQLATVATGTTNGISAATNPTATSKRLGGVTQSFVDNNGDGIVDYIFQNSPALTKVSVYNTSDEKLTLSNIGSIDFTDIIGYEDVAKDDYVLVVRYGDYYYLEVAEMVTGEVTSYSSSSYTMTVDGTTYADSALTDLTTDLTAAVNTAFSGEVGNELDMYLDASGNVIAYEVVSSPVGNYAVILNSGYTTSALGTYNAEVKVMLSDGTTGTYDVDLLASAKKWSTATAVTAATDTAKETAMAGVLNADGAVDTVVSYSIDDDGDIIIGLPSYIDQTNYHGAAATAYMTLSSYYSSYTMGAKTVYANDETVFFLKDATTGDYTVAIGQSNLPSLGLSTITWTDSTADGVYVTGETINAGAGGDLGDWGTGYYNDKTGVNVLTAYVATTASAYAANNEYAYVIDDYSKTVSSGVDYYTYDVVFEDGSYGSVTLKSSNSDVAGDAVAKNVLYSYTVNSDGYATMTVAGVNNAIVAYNTGSTVGWVLSSDTFTTGSVPLGSASIWNVEDTDNIYDTNLDINSVFSYVTDANTGAIKVAFVKEIQSDMTASNATLSALTITTGTSGNQDLGLTSTQTVSAATVTNVTGGTTTVTSIWINAAKNKVDPAKDSAGGGYTLATGDVVSITIAEDGMASRTVCYTVT